MKIIFVDNSTIVLKTLKTLVLELIESKEIECKFISDEKIVYKGLKDQTLEYDILFSEIDMKDISGYDLAKYAKSIEKYSNKKLVAITTLFSEEAQKKGTDIGINAWYIKSITQDSLQKSILDCIKSMQRNEGIN